MAICPLPSASHVPAAGEVPEGLDLAVMKMKEGERALVTIDAKVGSRSSFGRAPRTWQARSAWPAPVRVQHTLRLPACRGAGCPPCTHPSSNRLRCAVRVWRGGQPAAAGRGAGRGGGRVRCDAQVLCQGAPAPTQLASEALVWACARRQSVCTLGRPAWPLFSPPTVCTLLARSPHPASRPRTRGR